MSHPLILGELHTHHETNWNDQKLINALQNSGLISDLITENDPSHIPDRDLIRSLNSARLSQAKTNLHP